MPWGYNPDRGSEREGIALHVIKPMAVGFL